MALPKLTEVELAKLTKKEKLELLDALEEQERREVLKPDHYVPNEGQAAVHSSNKAERFVFSGNGAGKTCLLVKEMLWAADGYNPILKQHTPVPAKIILVLDAPEKVEEKIIPEIKRWYPLDVEKQCEKKGKPYYCKINFPNGSVISIMFHDQEEMKYESIEVHYVFCDEPPKRKIYIGLSRGAREKGSQPRFLIVGTPIAAAWLRKEIYNKWTRGLLPNTECFRFHTEVNRKNLRIGWIEDFSSKLTEQEKKIRLEGRFFDLDGLALANLFDESVHVIRDYYWNPSWPVVLSIDPAGNKPHVAVLLGCTPNEQLIALAEIASSSVPSQFAAELREWYKGYRIVDIVCDSLGSSPYSGGQGTKSFIRVLNDNGVWARATTFKEKGDEQWITSIKEVLAIPVVPDNMGQREPILKIHHSCKGLIDDVESVEWGKYRNIDELKPTLAIDSKDYLAALKYALASSPRYTKGREQVIRAPGKVGWSNNSRNRPF